MEQAQYEIPRIPASAGALIFDAAGRLLILKPTYKAGWTLARASPNTTVLPPESYTGICGKAHWSGVGAGGLAGAQRALARSAQEPDTVFAHHMDAGARPAAGHHPRHRADHGRLPVAGHRRGAGALRRL